MRAAIVSLISHLIIFACYILFLFHPIYFAIYIYIKKVLTFIRPGTMPGLLLDMIKELPYNQRSEEYMPLSRVQIYSAEDDSMSLNLFVYGEEAKQLSVADVTMTGKLV